MPYPPLASVQIHVFLGHGGFVRKDRSGKTRAAARTAGLHARPSFRCRQRYEAAATIGIREILRNFVSESDLSEK
jgi:hypothetical protein